MLSIIPGYELDFFEWLVDKRLKNFPLMPTEGTLNKIPMDTKILSSKMRLSTKS